MINRRGLLSGAAALAAYSVLPAKADFGAGNNLAGFWAFKPPIKCTFAGATFDNSNLTTYTYTSHAIGGPGLIVVCASGIRAAVTNLSSGTIGGVAATVHTSSNSQNPIGIMSRVVASGTTATITVTWSGGFFGCGIHVFRVEGYKSATPFASNSTGSNTSATSISTTVNTAARGILIGCATKFNLNTPTFDNSVAGGANLTKPGESVDVSGFAANTSASTPLTLTASWSGSVGRRSIAAASWL
jgi:hypothetical protein